MTRWAIRLDHNRKQLLPHDALELGDLVTGEDGDEFLMFRDRFVALRVASRVGGAERITISPIPATNV